MGRKENLLTLIGKNSWSVVKRTRVTRIPESFPMTGKRYPALAGLDEIHAARGRYLLRRRYPCYARTSNNTPLLIIEAAQNNPDNIDELPDEETAGCEELDDACDDLAGIDAVYPAESAEDQQAEQEGDHSGARGLVPGTVWAAMVHGVIRVFVVK